jgi:hypothetical protein
MRAAASNTKFTEVLGGEIARLSATNRPTSAITLVMPALRHRLSRARGRDGGRARAGSFIGRLGRSSIAFVGGEAEIRPAAE